MKKSLQKTHSYVFRLTSLYLEKQLPYPAPLNFELLGYFTSLKEVVKCINRAKKLKLYSRNYFVIFKVEEFALDKCDYEPLRFRIYDRYGKVDKEYIWWKAFRGIEKKDCRFQVGQIVEFMQFNNEEQYLNLGIITALPSTPDDYRKLFKEGCQLTACDELYRIFTPTGSESKFDEEKNRSVYLDGPGFTFQIPSFIFFSNHSVLAETKEQLLRVYEGCHNK